VLWKCSRDGVFFFEMKNSFVSLFCICCDGSQILGHPVESGSVSFAIDDGAHEHLDGTHVLGNGHSSFARRLLMHSERLAQLTPAKTRQNKPKEQNKGTKQRNKTKEQNKTNK
jgi:hypothetical protein